MNGVFDITLRMPSGTQRGRLELHDNGGGLYGALYALGRRHPFSGGRADGNGFAFRGTIRAGLVRIDYFARGEVSDGALTAVAETRYGSWNVEGRQIT